MLRTALKPRWLGLFAVLVLILVSFTRLGLWQLDVAKSKGRAEAVAHSANRPVADLTTLARPHEAFPADGSGRRVRATGSYAAEQVLVAPRRLDGRTGYWVVTPLVLDGGGTLAVVRGFTTDPASVPRPPSGTVTVVGSLAPGESPTDSPAPSTPRDGAFPADPVLGSIDLSVLVNRWHGDLFNAFAFALDEQRAANVKVDPAPLERVPPPAPDTGLSWRNAAYALQWWIFAAFAAYMWVRMVRDDAEQNRRRATPATASEQDPARDPQKEKSST